jgi:hypothetical protein
MAISRGGSVGDARGRMCRGLPSMPGPSARGEDGRAGVCGGGGRGAMGKGGGMVKPVDAHNRDI